MAKHVASEYAAELRRQGGIALEKHPDLPHRWLEDGSLLFPATAAAGFEVTLMPAAGLILVMTNTGAHEHIEGEPFAAVQDALGLVRDLLSPDMRIRERLAGNQPYRWIVERRTRDGWCPEASTGLLFWNWFGRRSERIHRNDQLPGRLVDAA